MVGSRHRSSAAAAAAAAASESTNTSTSNTSTTKVPKPPLEEWTTKEKLCLASLAIKHGNAWNSVARNMQTFVEKDRAEGWSNQKTCAAQFDKLMNELGVDKRPKRNEPSDGNSSSVIYKKMSEKRMKELEDSIVELRKLWLAANNDLESYDNGNLSSDKSDQIRQKVKPSQTTKQQTHTVSSATTSSTLTPTHKSSSKVNTSTSSESEKPPTRALTRRESSRKNLEITLSTLCKEASEIKMMSLLTKPTQELEKENYDKFIRKHKDMSIINERLGGEVDDPYAVMNDLLLIFQNAIMFYPPGHKIYKTAIELRDKLVPQWEKALIEKSRIRH